jgi:hypothetical protein
MDQFDTSRHEIPMSGWQRGFCLGFGVFIALIGVFIAHLVSTQTHKQMSLALVLFPLLISVYLVAFALRSRLVLDGAHIEVHYAFRERTADRSEIEGYRVVNTRNGSFWQLRLNDGRGTIAIQHSYDCAELRAWLAQVADLDERDRNVVLDEIRQSPELGATPRERLNALAQAKLWNYLLSAISIAAAIEFGFASGVWRMASAAVTILTPLAAIVLVSQRPLLFVLMKPKRDPRNDLGITLLAGAVGLIFGVRAVHTVSIGSLAPYIAAVALVMTVVLFLNSRNNPQFFGVMIAFLFFAGAYGFGVVIAANTLLDESIGRTYSVGVRGKHTSHGRSTSYYLELEPWGPIDKPNRLSVSALAYTTTAIGDAVCVSLRDGALNAAWYRQVKCEMEPMR